MSQAIKLCWICDYADCDGVWIAKSDAAPDKCAKCKRRRWNQVSLTVHRPIDVVIINPHAKTIAEAERVTSKVEEIPLAEARKRFPTVTDMVHGKSSNQVARVTPKIGQKCPHGWANWLQCKVCNERLSK